LDSKEQECDAPGNANLTTMRDASLQNTGPMFEGMTMSGPFHQKENGTSISSQEDSPVRTSASPAGAKDLKASDPACGGSLPESFAYFDPDTCWWKTYQGCLPLPMEENKPPWDAYLGSWPASGMTLNGKAYQLPPLVPRNSAFACSSSPTLRATEADQGCYQRDGGKKGKERATLLGVVKGWTPTMSANGFGCVDVPRMLQRREECKTKNVNGNGFGLTLEQYLAVMNYKATTPTLNAASADKGPRKCATKAENGGHQVNLVDVTAHLSGQGGGVLNPRWCEWYMGFPDGWCDLPSEDLETQ